MDNQLDAYIDGVRDLPPSPSVMIELLSLLDRPDRDIDQLVSLMSHDPSLTAEVLKRCNSAFFGGDSPATDIFEATFRLGFHEVYRIATMLFGARTMQCAGAKAGLAVDVVWEHSALAAVSAGVLAKRLEESEGMAFTAGLLHDVGKVILACAGGPAYADLVRQAPCDESLCASEKEHFGFDHTEIGSRLLARWGFPASIFTPVRFQHTPTGAIPFGRLTAMLHLANAMAVSLTTGEANTLQDNAAGALCMKVLQLEEAALAELLGTARNEAQRVKRLFRKAS